MNLNEQITSLDLSQRLKELGVKQESVLSFMRKNGGYVIVQTFFSSIIFLNTPSEEEKIKEWKEFTVSAFNVAELGMMLPPWYSSYRVNVDTPPLRHEFGRWRCEGGNPEHKESGKTEADARAKMLIYLIEKENKQK